MGQKINPISLRLQTTNRYFDFCWYNDFYYSDLFCQNLKIQRYLNCILKQLQYPAGRFFIQNSQKKTKIFIFFCSPIKSRRIKSNFFKTKYYKITKNVLTIKKNRIIKFIGKNNNKLSYWGSVPTLRESIQEKSVCLKYHLYRKYLQKFYTSIEVSPIPSDKMRAEITNKKLKSSVGNLLDLFRSTKKKSLKLAAVRHNMSNVVVQSPLQKRNDKKYKNKNRITDHTVSTGNNSRKKRSHTAMITTARRNKGVNVQSGSLLTMSKNEPSKMINLPTSDQFFQTRLFFDPNFFLNDLPKSKIFGNYRMSSLSVKQELSAPWSDRTTWNPNFAVVTPLPKQEQEGSRNSKCCFAGAESCTSPKESLLLYMDRLPYRKHIENVLTREFRTNIRIHTVKTYDHFRSALFLAEEIVYYLERRIPFRRIKNKVLKDVKLVRAVQGIRITCSGRVGGRSKKAQRAKKETIKYGQTSLHVFSSRIDFASKNALTAFGLVGVKVWICYRA